jgi:hypothetical protein
MLNLSSLLLVKYIFFLIIAVTALMVALAFKWDDLRALSLPFGNVRSIYFTAEFSKQSNLLRCN